MFLVLVLNLRKHPQHRGGVTRMNGECLSTTYKLYFWNADPCYILSSLIWFVGGVTVAATLFLAICIMFKGDKP